MSRRAQIFILTHGYPVFIASHLYFGDWCRRCQVIFNIVPIIVFGGLFHILGNATYKLYSFEKFCIKYLVCNLIFICCYYEICLFSSAKWIYDKNWQVAAFLLITLIFYIFNYRERK